MSDGYTGVNCTTLQIFFFPTDLKSFTINRVRRKWLGVGSMLGYFKKIYRFLASTLSEIWAYLCAAIKKKIHAEVTVIKFCHHFDIL